MKYLEKSYLVSTFLFPLPHNMHLFDDCDDTSSCWIQTALSSEKSLQWLIFIFAIIDSRGLTNNCLDFFFPSLCCCTENQPWDEQREMSACKKKKAFLISSKQQGFLSPHVHLNWLVLWLRAYSTCLPPCKAALPCWSVAHTWASSALSLSSGSSCGAPRLWLTGGWVHRTPLLLSSLPRQRGGGLCPGGLDESPCFVCPIVN